MRIPFISRMHHFFSVFFTYVSIRSLTDADCVFPTEWTSTWYDSDFREVEFGTETVSSSLRYKMLSGWTIESFSSNVTSWECVEHDISNGYFLFKGDQRILYFGQFYRVMRCMAYTKITDSSYRYYIMHNEEVEAGNQRVFVELDSGSVTSWDITKYCTGAASGPGLEEYHVLVKKGHENDVKQWCPIPLLGTFHYVHDDGTTQSCQSGSQFSACPTWTDMTFNYSLCALKQAFSANGGVHCVSTVEVNGNYYTTALNPDTITDHTNYDRFTCFAISTSGSKVYMSDSKGSCHKGQSSTVKATDGTGVLELTVIEKCYGNCSFPAQWNSTWHDSAQGEIEIDIDDVTITSGWDLSAYGTALTSWTCVTQDNASSTFLFRGQDFVSSAGTTYNVFRCVRWEKLTEYSYAYYLYSDVDANANNERIALEGYVSSVNTWDPSTICTAISPPATEEFHILVKKGFEEDVKQWCPLPLLGNFTYTHDDGSSSTCASGSFASACPVWSTLSFDYSICPTKQIFSVEGVGYCIYTVNSDATYFTSVLNPGTIDDVSTFRFTCLAISVSGHTVLVSDSSGSCERGQSSVTKSVDGTGTLTLSPIGKYHGF